MPESREPDDLPAGFDPLIVHPIVATGETGAIERPGDDRPAWVVGVLFAAFCALISGLVTVALTRDDSVEEVVDRTVVEPPAVAEVASESSGDDAGVSEVVVAQSPDDVPDSQTASVETESIVDERLAAAGRVRVGDDEFAIEASCAVHLPLAPNDADAQVSSYFFRNDDDEPRVIDRRFGARDEIGASVLGGEYSFAAVDDIGDAGAFVATFADASGDEVVLGVNPALDGGLDCDDTLVTNEQGQLAFPYTRIVMYACSSGTQGVDLFAAGITSEGGRFSAQANGDDTVTLTYRNAEVGPDLIDSAASSFESGDRLGYSGIVTNGTETLDITVDFDAGVAPRCDSSDVL